MRSEAERQPPCAVASRRASRNATRAATPAVRPAQIGHRRRNTLRSDGRRWGFGAMIRGHSGGRRSGMPDAGEERACGMAAFRDGLVALCNAETAVPAVIPWAVAARLPLNSAWWRAFAPALGPCDRAAPFGTDAALARALSCARCTGGRTCPGRGDRHASEPSASAQGGSCPCPPRRTQPQRLQSFLNLN